MRPRIAEVDSGRNRKTYGSLCKATNVGKSNTTLGKEKLHKRALVWGTGVSLILMRPRIAAVVEIGKGVEAVAKQKMEENPTQILEKKNFTSEPRSGEPGSTRF